jgi:hypothetical protein
VPAVALRDRDRPRHQCAPRLALGLALGGDSVLPGDGVVVPAPDLVAPAPASRSTPRMAENLAERGMARGWDGGAA